LLASFFFLVSFFVSHPVCFRSFILEFAIKTFLLKQAQPDRWTSCLPDTRPYFYRQPGGSPFAAGNKSRTGARQSTQEWTG
ncbi:hypothetical protein BJY04DRAFT_184257, partial [Aspergillus karnatakaensis]|uniref:uncharacterized protein n=1 Tax=Aspergillus karnatakaensis TaxID=1810916 RepID=UPI003CCDA9D1